MIHKIILIMETLYIDKKTNLMCGNYGIMGNYLHFTFIFFHGYRLDTLPMCLLHALGSKDNSVHTTAILAPSSDSSSSNPPGDTAFLRVPLLGLQRALLQVPSGTPRRPSTDQSCCAVRGWAPPHFSGGEAADSRYRRLSASLWGLETRALSHASCRSGPRFGICDETSRIRCGSSLQWSEEMRGRPRILQRDT